MGSSRISELVRLARAGRRLRPVFIVGEARSGTSLLYRLLQQQPAFGPVPVQLAESAFVHLILTARDLEAESWPMRNYLTSDDEVWARYLRTTAPLLAVRRVVVRSRPGLMHRRRLAAAVGTAMLGRAYLALAAEVRDVTRVVEKTPYHTPFVGHILQWFPDARVLYIARHPLDVITSYRRRGQVDARVEQWADLDIDTFANDYVTNTTLARRWAADRPDAFLLLRYEELVAEPTATIAAACRFASAEFDAGAVTGTESQPAPIGTDPDAWGDVNPRTKDWRHFIDGATAAELERRLAPCMSELGYQRYTSDGTDL